MARFGRFIRMNGKSRRALMAWVAMFALIVQAMAPLSVASAYDSALGGELQVICTAHGVKTIAIGSDGAPIDYAQSVQCPFCMMHGAAAVCAPDGASLTSVPLPQISTFARPHPETQASLWRAQPRPPRGPPLSV